MFSGNFKHNIDGNGRFIIPSQFREELGESFNAVKGKEGFIVLYSQSEFERRASALKGSTPEELEILFSFMSTAETITQDKQGRCVLSSKMREYVGLSRDAADSIKIVGMLDQIYICKDQEDRQPVSTPEDLYFRAEKAAKDAEDAAKQKKAEE
ncbi:MAG: hypothetical protein IJL87_06010 [Clostridia bacterium]|nr:hypothetical protein [Clostridia bacterium]